MSNQTAILCAHSRGVSGINNDRGRFRSRLTTPRGSLRGRDTIISTTLPGRSSLQGLRRQLWEADPSCTFCGTVMPLRQATLDHLIPLSQGGTHDRDNIVLACYRCSQANVAAMPREWRNELSRIVRVLERIVEERGC